MDDTQTGFPPADESQRGASPAVDAPAAQPPTEPHTDGERAPGGDDGDAGDSADGATGTGQARRRRRGSRGGQNRKRPAGAADDAEQSESDAPDPGDDDGGADIDAPRSRTPQQDDDVELPDRIGEGRVSDAEAAEQALFYYDAAARRAVELHGRK